ncbi:MAG: capsular exopolysaccharide synthesis family protein [Pseudohongiellaceae bacterium]|jgi:capsular exopolysaccharide synthesis family protein
MKWPFGSRRDSEDSALGANELVVLVDGSLSSRLVVYHDPHCYQAEQYRVFRTNLRAMNPTNDPRTLMFTSSSPDEGKSTTVANVALSLAEAEELKVCLVDMDLRGPRIHELFDLPRGPGLSDILLDRIDPRRALQQGGVPNLSILTAGRHTDKPNDVLGSEYLQDLLAFLKRDYHYIIVDSPPCAVFSDATHMSTLMDGVILVVALRDTMRHQAGEALAALGAVGANLVGTFVTGAETAAAHDSVDTYHEA